MEERDDPGHAVAVLRARIASRVADVIAARRRIVDSAPSGLDEEAVHDYRVGIRRLRVAMRALRPAWGKAALLPIELSLKALADATGDVRDEEVLPETLRALDLGPGDAAALARWKQGRGRRLAGARAAVSRKLAGPALGGQLSATLLEVERALAAPPARPMGLPQLTRRSIGKMLREVVRRAAETPTADVAGMHTLRIRIKRLRYAMELLFAAGEPIEEALRAAQKLQKRLGELHDVDEARARMARAWGLPASTRAAIAEGLAAHRQKLERRASRELAASVPALAREVAAALPREPEGDG